MEASYWIAIVLFFFWLTVGLAAPKNAFTDLEKVLDALTSTLMLLGFAWLAVNLFSPFFMGWLVPPEWIKLSSIFWWISFIGGLLGVFARKSAFETA